METSIRANATQSNFSVFTVLYYNTIRSIKNSDKKEATAVSHQKIDRKEMVAWGGTNNGDECLGIRKIGDQ